MDKFEEWWNNAKDFMPWKLMNRFEALSLWKISKAAERKRIIEEARKAAIADHAMYGDPAGMNALNRFAKAIEGGE